MSIECEENVITLLQKAGLLRIGIMAFLFAELVPSLTAPGSHRHAESPLLSSASFLWGLGHPAGHIMALGKDYFCPIGVRGT